MSTYQEFVSEVAKKMPNVRGKNLFSMAGMLWRNDGRFSGKPAKPRKAGPPCSEEWVKKCDARYHKECRVNKKRHSCVKNPKIPVDVDWAARVMDVEF